MSVSYSSEMPVAICKCVQLRRALGVGVFLFCNSSDCTPLGKNIMFYMKHCLLHCVAETVLSVERAGALSKKPLQALSSEVVHIKAVICSVKTQILLSLNSSWHKIVLFNGLLQIFSSSSDRKFQPLEMYVHRKAKRCSPFVSLRRNEFVFICVLG